MAIPETGKAAVDVPANAYPGSPISETIGGTGKSNLPGSTIKITGGPVEFIVPEDGAIVNLPESPALPASNVLVSGTSVGSAGDVTKCNAPNVLTITINSIVYYIPIFTQNT